MKKVLSLIMCAVLAFSVCAMPAAALTVLPLDGARAAAEREIQAFAASDDPMVTWNSSTQISSAINLYDLDDNINGYIYKLTTNGEQTGYIQVGKFGAGYSVMMLSFEGDHMVESKLRENGISTNTLSAPKVYFAGNFDYFVAQDEGLLDLTTGEVCTNTAAVRAAYTNYLTSVTPEVLESVTVGSTRSVTIGGVTGYNSMDLKTMAYHDRYGEYSNHCSPTAATNLVLYWSETRGKTALGTDPDDIFDYFYREMRTSPTDGTTRSNIYPAIYSYFAQNYANAYLVCEEVTCSNTTSGKATAYSSICGYIDDDIPMLLSVTDWVNGPTDNDPGGHSIDVWGYNSGGTVDYILITDNQDSDYTPTFTLLAFNNFNYALFVAVGYTV